MKILILRLFLYIFKKKNTFYVIVYVIFLFKSFEIFKWKYIKIYVLNDLEKFVKIKIVQCILNFTSFSR